MKKILCVTSHDLNAPDYGSVLRCRHIFRMLSGFGSVEVVLASRYDHILENARSQQGEFALAGKIHLSPSRLTLLQRVRRKLSGPSRHIEGYQASRQDCERLQRLMAQYDLVWVHGLETADAFNIHRWPNTVLDVDDVPSTVYRLRLSQPDSKSGQPWNARQMKAWQRAEKLLASRFDAVCVCSKHDRDELGAAKNVFILQNGFAVPDHAPSRNPVHPPQIGFVGTFIYGPNRDGVRWFVDDVWPVIHEKIPGVRLRLAGERGQNFFNSRNVDTLGWVEDMETEMANWSLAIVPILVGGGTRIKILDSFSRQCPVVSTSVGAYGHDVENGRELLIADSAEAFAQACLRILSNPTEGKRLAQNAWLKFLSHSTWEAQASSLNEIVAFVWKQTLPVKSRDAAVPVEMHICKNSGTSRSETPLVFPGKSAPRLSVIIPAFNRVRCVARAVESALAQTFKDIEIIAVDDGSSDGTAEVLEKFGDRIRLLRQENRGVSAARNSGVRAARGDWVAFLDSDDTWHPEKLERQLQAMEKHNAQICFTRCVNAGNKLLQDIEFVSYSRCEPEIFYVQNGVDSVCLSPRHPLVQTMVVEKTILEKAGLFDESLHAAEDADLIFRLSFLCGFLYLDRPLTIIHENTDNSLTYTQKLGPLARRNQSYLRLTAHMYWRLADISPEKLPVMRQRMGYFISRRAEIACAAGQLPVARTLARDGILFAGSFRDFARCAGILLFPGVVRNRAQRKWRI